MSKRVKTDRDPENRKKKDSIFSKMQQNSKKITKTQITRTCENDDSKAIQAKRQITRERERIEKASLVQPRLLCLALPLFFSSFVSGPRSTCYYRDLNRIILQKIIIASNLPKQKYEFQ